MSHSLFCFSMFSSFWSTQFWQFLPNDMGKQHVRIASTKVLLTSICCDWSSAIWAQALCQSCKFAHPVATMFMCCVVPKDDGEVVEAKTYPVLVEKGTQAEDEKPEWGSFTVVVPAKRHSTLGLEVDSGSDMGPVVAEVMLVLGWLEVFFWMSVGQKLSKWMLGGPLRTYKTKTPRTMSQRIPVHIACFLWDMYVKKTSFEKMCLSLSPFILPYPVTLRKKGAVDDFNQLNPLHTIQPYDMLLQLDEAKGSKAILDQLAAKNMPENVQLTVLRPKRTRISLRKQGSMALGIKLVLKEMFPGWGVTVWFCCCWWLDSLYICFFKRIKGDLKSWSCWSNLSIVQHFMACLHIELYYCDM